MFITFGIMSEKDTSQDQPDNSYYEEPNSTSKDFVPASALEAAKRGDSQEADNRPAGSMKVEHGVVIDLPLTNMLKRRVTELKECYIVLYDHFVIYKVVGRYEALDDNTETWVDYKCNYRWTRMRGDMTDVNMYYDNAENLWAVEVEFGKNPQTWYYEKGADAKRFYDVMQNYFVTRDQKP
jgi:hypothetical protein